LIEHLIAMMDLGLSLGLGLASQGSLTSSTTTTSSPGAGSSSPWAAALNSIVGDVRRDQAAAHAAAAVGVGVGGEEMYQGRASTSPDSAAALSSASGKRERELERSGSGVDDDDGADGAGGRKKLRLSKDQAAVLEECFKTHSTLNPKQKVALANRLGLRPRQVEVWFQNRRARTKLKQTEVDCEHLKRWCDQLADDNRRLHKELAELRALKATPTPPAAAPPLTTLTMCLSCKRVANAGVPSPAAAIFPGHPQFLCGFRDHAGAASSSYGGASSGLAKAVRAAR
jgi:homeobox-leucine zipper protein